MAAKEAARKEGTTYSVGQVDPELEGYSGKTWQSRRGNPSLEGAASGGGGFGVSAMDVGGPREVTRGMGNTTTQTQRGYTVKQMPWNMIDEGADQAFPNQQVDLATGGSGLVATKGMTFEMPDNLFKGLGMSALKTGAAMVVPGFGAVRFLGGKLFQKLGTNQSPGKQTALETFFGVDDNSYGHLFKQKAQ